MAQILKYVIGKDYRPLTVLEAKGGNTFTPDYDKENWVQARQYEDSLRQVFVEITNEDGSAYDLTGANVLFEGILPDNEHKILDSSHVVFYEDPTTGKFRFDMPAQAFSVAGQYKQAFFRVVKDYRNIATLEFKFEVLADMVVTGMVARDYISPLEEFFNAIKDEQIKDSAELKKIVDDKINEITNLMTALNQTNTATLSELSSAKTAVEALQEKIKQDGLFTQGEAEEFKKSVFIKIVNSFKNVDELSKSTNLKEGFVVETQGYYEPNDNGGAKYRVLSSPTDFTIALQNGLYAEPINDRPITPNMFGAKDVVRFPPTIDSTDAFKKALAFSDHVYVPKGSYKVQGLNIPANKTLQGSGQFSTSLYGYGDDIIKFTNSSYNNVLSDLKINADAGFAAVHCKYAPSGGDPYDSHNRIENVRTSGGKYGFFVEYPSRGVMIVNGYASGVSETLFNIQGTDNNLLSCGGQDANIGYELQNNNVMTSCSCFNISDRAVIVRGNWCQVVNFAGQDCQNGFYIPSKSNFITGKLDRMGFYTPGSGYDVMITENSMNNRIDLTTTEGRTPSHSDSNGKSYVQYVLKVSNASASGNLINITTELMNGVSPILCSRGGEGTFIRNNKVYVNGDLMSASRDRRISRQEIVDVSVTDGGNFTPQTSGYLLVTVIHDETTNYANCEIKTSDYYNSAQQVIYNKQGYSRLRETVMVPVFAFEKIIFTVSNSTTMSMTAKFIPFK